MQLFLDSFGAFLGVRNGQFFVRMGTSRAEHSFPIRDVDVIFLTRGTTHTSDALILALNNDIPVIFWIILDTQSGKFGLVNLGQLPQLGAIKSFFYQYSGVVVVGKTFGKKIDNQNGVLHQFSIYFNNDQNALRRLAKTTAAMQGLTNNFDRWRPKDDEPNTLTANTFRAWEATASRYYFRFLASVVPPQYAFENRNFRPALDKFNCLLNYLYGMLYAYIVQTLHATSLPLLNPSTASAVLKLA